MCSDELAAPRVQEGRMLSSTWQRVRTLFWVHVESLIVMLVFDSQGLGASCLEEDLYLMWSSQAKVLIHCHFVSLLDKEHGGHYY